MIVLLLMDVTQDAFLACFVLVEKYCIKGKAVCLLSYKKYNLCFEKRILFFAGTLSQ